MNDIVENYHRTYYEKVHGAGSTGAANNALHRHLEGAHSGNDHFPRVLELGAGTCQHFPYVEHGFDVFLATDLLRPDDLKGWPEVEAGTIPTEPGKYFATVDAHTLPYEDGAFDRLVATCLLLHLSDPYAALAEWRRVVRPGGALDILLPCDPGLAVRTFRRVFTQRRAARLGCDHFALVNVLEHRNHAHGMLELAKHIFADDELKLSWRPFPLVASWNLNTHVVLRVRRR